MKKSKKKMRSDDIIMVIRHTQVKHIYIRRGIYNAPKHGGNHGKLGCVYAVTITAMSILLVREGNFQVLVICKMRNGL